MAEKKRGRPKGSKSGYTRSEKTIAQREKTLPPAICKTPEDIAYNARLIEYSLKVQQLGKTSNVKDLATVKNAFMEYLKLSAEYGFKISNLSACAAMGITTQALINWTHGSREEYREFAETVKMICSLSREQLIMDGKLNPVIGIFWQRNFDGLRNDTEQQQAIQEEENAGDIKSAAEYAKKYGKLIEE